MIKIRQSQFDALQAADNEKTPERVLQGLIDQGIEASRDPATGDVIFADGREYQSRVSFGADGLIRELRRPSGQTQRFTHAQGRLAEVKHPGGETWRYAYDPQGRIEQFEAVGHARYQFQYDPEGQLNTVTHPDGRSEHFERNPLGEVVRHTSRSGAVVTMSPGDSGDLLRTDPLGRTVQFRQRSLGGLESVHFPDGTSEAYAFDPETNQATVKQRSGGAIVCTTDPEGRPTQVRWDDGTGLELAYDDDGLPIAANNAADNVAFAYDDAGQPVEEDSGAGSVSRTYDDDGRLIALVTHHGEEIGYHYNLDGRLIAIDDWENRRIEIEPSPTGTPSRICYPNGVVETWTVGGGEPVQIDCTLASNTGSVLSRQVIEYNACDRVCRVLDQWGETARDRLDRKLDYDADFRIADEIDRATGGALARHAYDAVGNMVQDGDLAVAFGPMDNPTSRGADPIEYDALGNIVGFRSSRGPIRLTFSADSRLASATADGKTFRYTYDALCRRIGKSDGETTWTYGWAGFQLLWEEYRAAPDAQPVRRDYLYAPSCVVPIAFREQGQTFWIQSDHRGAVVAVHDQRGRVVWRCVYESFGQVRTIVNEVRQPWRFAGQYFDDETGLCYNMVRYYSSELKSYLSLDPRWQEPEGSKYSYCNNDPWNRADPVGTIAPLLLGAIAVGAAGLIGGAIAAYNAPEGEKLSAFGKGFAVGAGAALVGIGTALALPYLGIAATGLAGLAIVGAVEGAASSVIDDLINRKEICVKCALASAALGAALGLVIPVVGGFLARRLLPKSLLQRLTRARLNKKFGRTGNLNEDINARGAAEAARNRARLPPPKKGAPPSPPPKKPSPSESAAAEEAAYQKYLKRKQRQGKPPRNKEDWKKTRDYWRNDSPMARGNKFNETAGQKYDYNEVVLENGKRLDSYDPAKGEIISRKATDFEKINPETFEGYLDELNTKYPPGEVINSRKYPDLDGQPLKGKQILEVPKTNESAPNRAAFEEMARKKGIEIRYTEE